MTSDNDAMDSFLQRATRGFEADSPVLAGDDKRIERIERAVQRRYGKDTPQPKLRRQLAFAVSGGFLMASAAFAALQFASTRREPAKPAPRVLVSAPVTSVTAGAVASAGPPAPATPPTAAPAATAPVPAPVVATKPRAVTPSSAPPATAVPSEASAKAFDETPAAPTAAELFAAANRARVAGDASRSISLSEQLIDQFPKSAEATSTHLSLGLLLLQQGQAARALGHFETYERLSSGEGRAEALWGKARALQRLGRTQEERSALDELVEKYPRAAYVAAAKKRLAALQ
jgi:TolA-binding protein